METDNVLITGIHGVLELKPWIDTPEFDEDVFSLAVQRSEALGLTSTDDSISRRDAQWGHNDGGGDWTQDSRSREVAWLQVSPENSPGQLVPIQLAASVLSDVLHRVGELDFQGIHVITPVALAASKLPYVEGWFAAGDPHEHSLFTVTLRAEHAQDADHSSLLVEEVNRRKRGVFSVRCSAEPDVSTISAHTGYWLVDESTKVLAFTCEGKAWSMELAARVAEVFLSACRAAGFGGLAMVEVARTLDESSRP